MSESASTIGDTELSYELPSVVRSLQSGWQIIAQCTAVVSALLAILAGRLLIFIKDSDNFEKHPHQDTVVRKVALVLSYCALFFQISAALSSLILIDRLAELPFRSSRQWNLQVERKENPGMIPGTSSQLMKRYQGGVVWSFVKWHWLISILLGMFSIVAQVTMYIWLEEPHAVAIVMTIFVVLAFLPALFIIPYSLYSRIQNTS